jgi:hypothetical protein
MTQPIDPTLHIPDYVRSYTAQAKIESPNKRLLLIGLSGAGKSYSTEMTAPNPVVLDVDNNLPPETAGRISIVPMCDREWIKASMRVANVPEGIMHFILNEAKKMTLQQTLVIDTLSTVCDELRRVLEPRMPKGKDGNPDGFWFWREWAKWLCDFCSALKMLKCNVVLIAHETEMRETDTGKMLGYLWWLPGQEFSPRLPSFFTDVFRQVKITQSATGMKLVGEMDGKTQVKIEYLWQVHPTQAFPAAKTTIKTNQLMVPATWDSFK